MNTTKTDKIEIYTEEMILSETRQGQKELNILVNRTYNIDKMDEAEKQLKLMNDRHYPEEFKLRVKNAYWVNGIPHKRLPEGR